MNTPFTSILYSKQIVPLIFQFLSTNKLIDTIEEVCPEWKSILELPESWKYSLVSIDTTENLKDLGYYTLFPLLNRIKLKTTGYFLFVYKSNKIIKYLSSFTHLQKFSLFIEDGELLQGTDEYYQRVNSKTESIIRSLCRSTKLLSFQLNIRSPYLFHSTNSYQKAKYQYHHTPGYTFTNFFESYSIAHFPFLKEFYLEGVHLNSLKGIEHLQNTLEILSIKRCCLDESPMKEINQLTLLKEIELIFEYYYFKYNKNHDYHFYTIENTIPSISTQLKHITLGRDALDLMSSFFDQKLNNFTFSPSLHLTIVQNTKDMMTFRNLLPTFNFSSLTFLDLADYSERYEVNTNQAESKEKTQEYIAEECPYYLFSCSSLSFPNLRKLRFYYSTIYLPKNTSICKVLYSTCGQTLESLILRGSTLLDETVLEVDFQTLALFPHLKELYLEKQPIILSSSSSKKEKRKRDHNDTINLPSLKLEHLYLQECPAIKPEEWKIFLLSLKSTLKSFYHSVPFRYTQDKDLEMFESFEQDDDLKPIFALPKYSCYTIEPDLEENYIIWEGNR